MNKIKRKITFLVFSLWLSFCILLSVFLEWRLVDRVLISPFPFMDGFIENVMVPVFAIVFFFFLNPVFKSFGLDLEIFYIKAMIYISYSLILLLWIAATGLFIYLLLKIFNKKLFEK